MKLNHHFLLLHSLPLPPLLALSRFLWSERSFIESALSFSTSLLSLSISYYYYCCRCRRRTAWYIFLRLSWFPFFSYFFVCYIHLMFCVQFFFCLFSSFLKKKNSGETDVSSERLLLYILHDMFMMMHMCTGYITSQSCLVSDISLWLQGTELYLGKRKKHTQSSLKESKKTHTSPEVTERKRENSNEMEANWNNNTLECITHRAQHRMKKKLYALTQWQTYKHTHANISINVCGLLDYRVWLSFSPFSLRSIGTLSIAWVIHSGLCCYIRQKFNTIFMPYTLRHANFN